MPITLPNLDDRRYADLVEEARDLLVANAPALTNHNPSDPVITLTELFAYFTEVLLFRVNNVTDANRVKFLRLLNGPDWPLPPSHDALEAEVRRTVLDLRSTDRAVTNDDFEFLALASDPAGRIARAHSIPERDLEASDPAQRLLSKPGHVSVVIVPFQQSDLPALQTIVTDYLEPRRLLTARVHVVGPQFVPVHIQVTLRLLPDALESQVRPRAIQALTTFLDPIVGRDGNGWPLGRNVYVSELYRLLDTLPGVDFVRRTVDSASSKEIDELATTSAFAGRLVRNDAGDLISIALDPDELVDYQRAAADTDIDIVIEQSPTAA
ncbi:MAG: baseplate J/gp47 family protein [bacterium]